MAASMHRVTFSVFRHIRSNVCSNGLAQRRQKSHDSAKDTEDNYLERNKPSVTLSRDESMIICWHPEPKFPYECSKPMPRETEDTVQGDSPLKLQYIRDFRIRNRPTGPTISELSCIFYDTKHPFYPRPRATRRKVRNLPRRTERASKERDYLYLLCVQLTLTKYLKSINELYCHYLTKIN